MTQKRTRKGCFLTLLTTDDNMLHGLETSRPSARPQQEPTDEPATSDLEFPSWLWVYLQCLLARIRDSVVNDVNGTWASLRGGMVLLLPWITAALGLVFDSLSTVWM